MKITVEDCASCRVEGTRGINLNAGHLIRNVHFDEQEARHLLELLQRQIVEWDKEPKERIGDAD